MASDPPSKFQSTPSGGKATATTAPARLSVTVSIHAFRGEGDDGALSSNTANVASFNPRLPGGRRQKSPLPFGVPASFNPRLPGGRRRIVDAIGAINEVSIHAFRGEGDQYAAARRYGHCGFQSTPSGGKATWINACHNTSYKCFNPRLPGGRRRLQSLALEGYIAVSIHAFRGEGDTVRDAEPGALDSFNPRLPGGRRHGDADHHGGGRTVSIHAFRGEGDDRQHELDGGLNRKFQSTPSGGKATHRRGFCDLLCLVSIHAFRGEGD